MQIDKPIIIALVVFIIILLVFFLVMPEYNTFEDLQTQLGEKKSEYDAQFAYYAAIADTYDNLQSHSDDLKKIDDALPQESVLGQLIYALQDIAKENGMIVKDLFLSPPSSIGASSNVGTGNVKDVVLSMDLIGSYSSLGTFMASIEKSSRIFEITNISFGSSTQSSSRSSQSQPQAQFQSQQTYNFSVQVVTHSY